MCIRLAPPTTRWFVAVILLVLGFPTRSYPQKAPLSEAARKRNLEMCRSGRYPALCNHSLLSRDELVRTREAERRENLKTCMSGLYPALCRHDLLTPAELKQVRESERQENLSVCLTGLYPALCNHSLLGDQERMRVAEAERAENLRTCLSGRYPALCNHSLLSQFEAKQVAEAEKLSPPTVPPASAGTRKGGNRRHGRRSGGAGCEDGHWIDSVSSDGEIVKLEDGSVWEVDPADSVDSALWLPVTDVIVCEDKIINVDDNESVGVTRLR